MRGSDLELPPGFDQYILVYDPNPNNATFHHQKFQVPKMELLTHVSICLVFSGDMYRKKKV